MAFSSKKIQVQLSLASGEFEGGGNAAEIDDLRVELQMRVTGQPSLGEATGAIYGLPLSMMQQLVTIGSQFSARYKNGVDILAGDADSGMSLIFSGVIFNGYMDAAQQPETCFRFVAQPLAFESVNNAPATSIQGPADVAGLIQNLVGQTGLKGFKNNGVSAKLANPYLYGSPWSQIQRIVDAAGIDATIDAGVFVISPRGVPLTDQAPIVSPATGLVSYPIFSQNQIILRTLFNPQIKIFGSIQVQSALQPACGSWQVISIDYDLESIEPGGNWYQTLTGVPIGTH